MAGRRTVTSGGALLSGAIVLFTAVSLLAAPIPVQAVPQLVRMLSLAAATAGLSGIAEGSGRTGLARSVLAGALLLAVLDILMPDDLPAGNPNRAGALYSLAIVLAAAGATGLPARAAAPAALVTAAALVASSFVTAIAACLGGLLLLLARRGGRVLAASGALLCAAVLAILTAFPRIAAGIHPSLELRALIWNRAVSAAAAAGPLGTGLGQSRLAFDLSGDDRLALLAGPDRRIDELHSDILTFVVEGGAAGVLLLASAARLLSRRGTGGWPAAVLCVLPLLAADLPLATPLGMIPCAAALAPLAGGGRIRIPTALCAVFLVLSAAWGAAVAGGYLLFESGTRAALQGRRGEAAEILGRASGLIPWEERVLLARATALDQDGRPDQALPVIERFNDIYPRYWLGWAVEGGVLGRLGMLDEADAAFLEAVRLAPSALPELPVLAYNAARTVPEAVEDRILVAKHAVLLFGGGPAIPAEALPEASRRFLALAESLDVQAPELSDSLAALAGRLRPAVLDRRTGLGY